jgi:hypothetical protein
LRGSLREEKTREEEKLQVLDLSSLFKITSTP